MTVLGLALLVALANGGCRTSPRIDGPPPRVEVRLAEFDPTEGFTTKRTRQGETLYVSDETLLDLEDIFTTAAARQGDDDRLLLNVKAGSRLRLEAATESHLGRPIAVLIDDEVVYVPLLATSISRQVPVRIGRNGISVEDARRVADAVADQRDFGPWSARSGDAEASRAGRARAARARAPEATNASDATNSAGAAHAPPTLVPGASGASGAATTGPGAPVMAPAPAPTEPDRGR